MRISTHWIKYAPTQSKELQKVVEGVRRMGGDLVGGFVEGAKREVKEDR